MVPAVTRSVRVIATGSAPCWMQPRHLLTGPTDGRDHETTLAGLLTCGIHSSLLLGPAFAITRGETLSAFRRDFI